MTYKNLNLIKIKKINFLIIFVNDILNNFSNYIKSIKK